MCKSIDTESKQIFIILLNISTSPDPSQEEVKDVPGAQHDIQCLITTFTSYLDSYPNTGLLLYII